MNLLRITLCVIIEAILIIAKTGRLPANNNFANKIAAFSAPLFEDNPPTTSYVTSNELYNYSYNTDTDIQAQEDGYLNHIDTEQEALEARGSYGYTDAEYNTFQASYVANENESEFQPEGAHLPKIPPF